MCHCNGCCGRGELYVVVRNMAEFVRHRDGVWVIGSIYWVHEKDRHPQRGKNQHWIDYTTRMNRYHLKLSHPSLLYSQPSNPRVIVHQQLMREIIQRKPLVPNSRRLNTRGIVSDDIRTQIKFRRIRLPCTP